MEVRYGRLITRVSDRLMRPEDIKRIYADGALVTIALLAKPAPGLRSVQFSIAPEYRDEFFAQFVQTYPGLLPGTYERAAAQRIAQKNSNASATL